MDRIESKIVRFHGDLRLISSIGDVRDEPVDAIVDAANSRLARGGGVAAAFSAVALLSIACASPPPRTSRTEDLTVEDRDIVLSLDVSRSTIDPWRSAGSLQLSSFLMHEVRGARAFLAAVDPGGAPQWQSWRSPGDCRARVGRTRWERRLQRGRRRRSRATSIGSIGH
jgi:hypothetical protein